MTEELELVFDTLASSRKAANLRANPRIALVIGGWNDAEPRTVRYQGVADFPVGAALEELRKTYFAAFPDGPTRLSWPGITYVRVKPQWIRYSDYTVEPPRYFRTQLPWAMSAIIPRSIQPFWDEFHAATGGDALALFYEAFHFDDDGPSANELAQLVLTRNKARDCWFALVVRSAKQVASRSRAHSAS